MNSISTMLSRPGLYLRFIDKQLTAASMFYNFVKGVSLIDTSRCKLHQIHLVASDTVYTMVVYGCSLDLEVYQTNITAMFDIQYHDRFGVREPHISVGLLRHIVWFAEHCIVDCSISSVRHKQVFFQGRPLLNSIDSSEATSNENIDSLKFCFTLRPGIFDADRLDHLMLDNALAEWKQYFSENISDYSQDYLPMNAEILSKNEVPYFHHAIISFNSY